MYCKCVIFKKSSFLQFCAKQENKSSENFDLQKIS